MWPSHTRHGPSTPSSYSTANTRPPLASIRAFSAGKSGLWSMVNCTAVIPPDAFLYPNDARESPMLAIVQLLSRITTQLNVVPEKSVSIVLSRKISASHRAITSVKAAWMLPAKSLCLKR